MAATVIAPIKRQEPGHYAFYQLSARALWAELAPWQKWLVRRLRRISFAPVGVNNERQLAELGRVMRTLHLDERPVDLATDVARVEHELLWARRQGLTVPAYVARAFRDAVEAGSRLASAAPSVALATPSA